MFRVGNASGKIPPSPQLANAAQAESAEGQFQYPVPTSVNTNFRPSASSALNRRPKSHQPSSPHSSLTELADHDHHDHDESGSDSNSNSSSSQEENSYYSSSDESESTPDEEDQYDPSSVGRYRTRRQPLPKRKDLSGSVYLPTKRTSRPPTKTKATTAAQWVGLPGDDEEVVRKVREQAGTQTIRDEEGEGSAGVLLVVCFLSFSSLPLVQMLICNARRNRVHGADMQIRSFTDRVGRKDRINRRCSAGSARGDIRDVR